MSQKVCLFEKEIKKVLKLDYLVHLPKNYEEKDQWPMILFLHGMGERGDDLEKVKKIGLPHILEEDEKFPFIVVSPQCPDHEFWLMEQEALYLLLQEIKDTYRINDKQVYLTGLSMGGFGTWSLAVSYPQEFAAIVPICGGYEPLEKIKSIKNVPVWNFHGDKDDIVPIENSHKVVEKLKELGGNVKFTIYQGGDHDAWTETYANEEVYKWMLSHEIK